MLGEYVRFLCTSCKRWHKKNRANEPTTVICLCHTHTGSLSKENNVETKILNSQNRFMPFISSLFGLNSESMLFFFSFRVFYSKNSSF